MKMKKPDLVPALETGDLKETPEQIATRENFAIAENARRKIAELRDEMENRAKSEKDAGFRVIDRRIGFEDSDFDLDSYINQAEAKIKDLENVRMQAMKERKNIFPNGKKEDPASDAGEKSRKVDIAAEDQAEIIEKESKEIDRLAELELADQMEKEKEKDGEGFFSRQSPGEEEPVSKTESDSILSPKLPEPLGNNDTDKLDNEKRIELLGKILEEQRRAYVIRDYNMDKHSSALKKFFGIEKRSQLEEFNKEYEAARSKYENALKNYTQEILRTQVTNEEEARILTEFLTKGEYAILGEERNNIKLENSPRFERIKRGAQVVIDRYRKLPLWKKLTVSSVLIVSGVGATGMAAYRGLGAAASVVGYKQMFEGIAQKLQSKKDLKEVEKMIKNSKIEGIGEVQKELLIRNLNASIQSIDKKIQKKKMWGKLRTWLAVGAGAGTFVVGPRVAAYIGEKFQDAAELISEKIESMTESVGDYFDHPGSKVAMPIEPENISGTEDVLGVESPPIAPVENIEEFDKLANEPFKEMQSVEKNIEADLFSEKMPAASDMKPSDENLSGQSPEKPINQEGDNMNPRKILSKKLPEIPEIRQETVMSADDLSLDEKKGGIEIEKMEQMAEKVPEVEINLKDEDDFPKNDPRTEARVFAKEPVIEEMYDLDQSRPGHSFDPVDEVKNDDSSERKVIPSEEIPVPSDKSDSIPSGSEAVPEVEKIEKPNVLPAPPESELTTAEVIPEQPAKAYSLETREQVESMTSGVDKILSTSDSPDQIMVFLRQELCSRDIQNWRGICLNSVDSLIAEQSPGGLGEKMSLIIEKLGKDYGLGDSIKPLYGETVESWTRRAGELLMESKK